MSEDDNGGLGAHRGEGEENGSVPLFDEVCFMEINSGRPSRFTPPTAQEILSRHGVPVVSLGNETSSEVSGSLGYGSGAWQRTMEEVTEFLGFKRLNSSSTTLVILNSCPADPTIGELMGVNKTHATCCNLLLDSWVWCA